MDGRCETFWFEAKATWTAFTEPKTNKQINKENIFLSLFTAQNNPEQVCVNGKANVTPAETAQPVEGLQFAFWMYRSDRAMP